MRNQQVPQFSNKSDHFCYHSFRKVNREAFERIISQFQDFISVFLFQMLNKNVDSKNEVKILQSLLNVLDFFHDCNELYNLISYEKFYNNSINESFDLRVDSEHYFQLLKNKELSDKKFCFIKYHWMFDAASKQEILCYYHEKQQRKEVLNSMEQDIYMSSAGIRNNMYLKLDVLF